MLGVNARDLATFAIDRRAQLELVARIPADRIVDRRERDRDPRAGCGSRARRRRRRSRRLDADARGRPGREARRALSRPLVKVCGLTREEDVAAAVEAGADLLGFILVPESPRAATGVLPVPDGMLSVAVWVGEAGEAEADLDQVHTVEEGKVRGREAALLREGTEVARLLDLPWEGTDPDHWRRGGRGERTDRPRRQARAGQRAGGDRRRAALGGRRGLVARVAPGDQGSRQGEAIRGGSPLMTTDTTRRPTAPTAAATCPRR